MRFKLALGALALCAGGFAQAGIPVLCERASETTAAGQDRVLQFAGAVKRELEASGAAAALISRAGLDLERFGLLYSHAGVALRDNPGGRWAVRQLYYACDESRPRLFDQGMAGFALGADAPGKGHVALVFLPAPDSALLERAALDKRTALGLLGGEYSANAYAFGTRFQNCNQWVAELMASAWGKPDSEKDGRKQAQDWLKAQDYAAGPVRLPAHWMVFAAQFVPLLHIADHPVEDLQALALRVSIPDALEQFVHARTPQARRVELCHDTRHIVVHRGWDKLGADCTPMAGDEVIALAP